MRGVARCDREQRPPARSPHRRPAARPRAEAAVRQVGDQKGEGIAEGAPGQIVAEAGMVERILDEDVRREDDEHHGGKGDREIATVDGSWRILGRRLKLAINANGRPRAARRANAIDRRSGRGGELLLDLALDRCGHSCDSSSSLALARKASRPPRCSTERSALAEMRRRTERCSVSDCRVTLQRFGRNFRLVLRFEWLTRWPLSTALPVSSQRRDMASSYRQWGAAQKSRGFA